LEAAQVTLLFTIEHLKNLAAKEAAAVYGASIRHPLNSHRSAVNIASTWLVRTAGLITTAPENLDSVASIPTCTAEDELSTDMILSGYALATVILWKPREILSATMKHSPLTLLPLMITVSLCSPTNVTDFVSTQ